MIQNIHAHAWDQAQHFIDRDSAESDKARGFRIDLNIQFESFMADAEPFDRVVVFGMKAHLTGTWVPDQWIADFVARAPDKLVGFASCEWNGLRF